MAKPVKNQYFCVNAGRVKMKFDSEREAQRFIEYNGDDVPNHNNPLRAYYCECCMAWHITKSRYKPLYAMTSGMDINTIQAFSRRQNKNR